MQLCAHRRCCIAPFDAWAGRCDERRVVGGVLGGDVTHDRDVESRSTTGAVEHEIAVAMRWFRSGEPDTRGRIRFHRLDTEEAGCSRSFGCDHDPVGLKLIAGRGRNSVGRDLDHRRFEPDRRARQIRSELLGDCPHSQRRHRSIPAIQALEDDIEHAMTGGQFRVELNPPDEGPKELIDNSLAETITSKRVDRGAIRSTEQIGRRCPPQPEALTRQPQLVGQRRNRSAQGGQSRARPTERVANRVHLRAVPDTRAGIERSKIEGIDVELAI